MISAFACSANSTHLAVGFIVCKFDQLNMLMLKENCRDPQWNCRQTSCMVRTGVRVLNHIPLCCGERSFKITQGEREKKIAAMTKKDSISFLFNPQPCRNMNIPPKGCKVGKICNEAIRIHLEKEEAREPGGQIPKEERGCFTLHSSTENALRIPQEKIVSSFI